MINKRDISEATAEEFVEGFKEFMRQEELRVADCIRRNGYHIKEKVLGINVSHGEVYTICEECNTSYTRGLNLKEQREAGMFRLLTIK